MTYKIKNVTQQKILILLNNNSLISLEPEEILAPLPIEEISNNFTVEKLAEWGLIALDQVTFA